MRCQLRYTPAIGEYNRFVTKLQGSHRHAAHGFPEQSRLLFSLNVVIFCLCLAACQGFPEPSDQAGVLQGADTRQTVSATPYQPAATLTFIPSPQPIFTPTVLPSPTIDPCTRQAGTIEENAISFAGRAPFAFRVYFPPCFAKDPQTHYPVLYMIHGQTYKDDQWERIGIGRAADDLIQQGKAPPFMIVMPQEENTYADIYTSSFSPNLLDGLIPWIDANYPTCAERACRAIGGLSRGGAWALHLGFTHWELFSALGLHSTPPFNNDPIYFYIWLRSIPTEEMPRVYIDAGRKDPFFGYASQFEALLVKNNIAHEWQVNEGGHTEEYWSAHVADYLAWYSAPWNNLPQLSSSTQTTNKIP